MHGHWFNESGTDFPAVLQTPEDRDIEAQWKNYMQAKKAQKEIKKTEELLLKDLTGARRMKYLIPVDDLLANLQKQSRRFGEKVE